MKKHLLIAAAAFAAMAGLTGCMSVNTNDAAVPAKACVAKKFEADIVAKPAKVTGKASVHCLFGIFTWGVSSYADDAFACTSNNSLSFFTCPVKVANQGATYNACAAAKADMLVAAKYKVDTKDFFVYKQISSEVTGFPAVVKGVK